MARPPKDRTLSAAEARIAALEAELARYRAQERLPIDSSELARAEAWLRQLVTRLFDRDDTDALAEALAELGQFLAVDDSLLVRVDGGRFHIELAWQKAPGALQDLQQFKLEHLPGALSLMREGQVRADHDVLSGHFSSPQARALAEQLGIGAYLTVPVLHHGELHSFLALLQRGGPRRWSQNDIHVAEAFAAVLVLALNRQQTQQQLQLSQQRFHDAQAATRDGLWEWDLTSGQLYLSDSLYRMFGYEPGELPAVPDTLRQLLHPDEHHYFDRFRAHGEGDRRFNINVLSREVRMRHRDGHDVWCFVRARFSQPDSQGLPTRILCVHADISRFKAVQEELSVAKALADSASQAKSEFLTRMSHEIRTPMNAIIGMGHLLADTRLSRAQRDYLDSIDQAANSLLSLINEILDFSKIEAGTIVLEHTHFDLTDCLNKLARKTGPIAERKGVEVIFHLAPEVPQFLKGDSLRLRQALFNLVDNAIKFSDGGEIRVGVSLVNADSQSLTLRFVVSDSGIGMDAEQLSELFTPFMQLDGSSKRRFGGSGLGLTVSKHLIELMHGEISVKSQKGKGSRFEFTARFGQSQIGAQPVRDKNQKFRRLKTLVVDDNKSARQILTNLARHLELQADAVDSASAAYQALLQADADQAYDLVLMDYRMPDEDGLCASRHIKQRLPLQQQPAIILISAFHRDEVFRDGDASGIESFISKPISQSHLFDAIAEVFGDQAFDTPAPSLAPEQVTDILRGKTVLLAEDNLVNQKVAVGILKKMDVTVVLANNGQEAIDQLMRQPTGTFAAILMDMEMPEVDGYEATRAIRQGNHCADIPIIAMTAHAMRGDKERCLDAGMDGYITKPVKPDLLYSSLATFIGKTRATQQS